LAGSIRRALASVPGGAAVLDVGCGSSPYRRWLPPTCRYTGLDVADFGSRPDIIVAESETWPVGDETYDAVICREVLVHATDHDFVLREIFRVLKPRGLLIVTTPFLFGEHGTPHDFRRFSIYGLQSGARGDYEIHIAERNGRTGTVLGTLFINWANASLYSTKTLRYLQALLLPVWIPICLTVNVLSRGLDAIDNTGSVYSNVLLVAKKLPVQTLY
jgi:SAM-dependent methyltransferase